MAWRWLAAAAVSALAAASPAPAAPTPAQMFGTRQDVSDISLSPDGKRIAMVRPVTGAGSVVSVFDLAAGGQPKSILSSSGRPDQIRDCAWTTATRLICQITTIINRDGLPLTYSRMLAINADGTGLKELSAETPDALYGAAQNGGTVIDLAGDDHNGASVLMTRAFGEQTSTGTLVSNTRSGLGVERVNSLSLRRETVEPPNSSASDYISDGYGTVRVMGLASARDSGMLNGRTAYLYRKRGERSWRPLSTVTSDGENHRGFEPFAVDRDADVAYGFDDHDGRLALYRVSLDGSLTRSLVLDNPNVDVDGLIEIGRQHRVIGASFATDRRTAVFFDPQLSALSASLRRALPKAPIIRFVDASADEQQLVLFAGSDVDPGRYYLFDRASRKLSEILPVRPLLDGVALAPVQSISFKAADGTSIPAYLTLPPGSDGKNLPAIVLPHGGPEARDEWGFDWLSQFFAHRGYAVLQPNFRGSTGYGSAFFAKNGFRSWRTAIGDVNDAGRYLLSTGIAAPGKLAIFGWSYGGYAALQSAVLDPDLFKAIVAVAPVTDFETLRGERSRFVDSAIEDARIGHGDDVRAGSPAQNAGRFKAPVLMFHGDADQNVGVGESRLMASRLRGAGKRVDLVEFKGLTHQLDDSQARTEMLEKSDAFLREALHLGG